MAGVNFGLPAGKQDGAGLVEFDQVLDAGELLVDALGALDDTFPEHGQALLEAGQREQTALDDGGTNLGGEFIDAVRDRLELEAFRAQLRVALQIVPPVFGNLNSRL